MAFKLDTSKAVDVLGIQDGMVRATNFSVVVHQYPKREGSEKEPIKFTALKVDMVPIDEETGKVLGDKDTKYYQFCWERKETGALDWLPSEDGDDGMDGDVGDEGNYVVPSSPASKWNKKSTSFKFIKSLEDAGVEIPEDWSKLNGLEGYITTEVEKYKTAEGKEAEAKVQLFRKVMSDSLGKKGKSKDKAEKSKGKEEKESKSSGGDDAESAGLDAVTAVIKSLREQGKETLAKKTFLSKLSMKVAAMPKKVRGGVEELIGDGDTDWMGTVLGELDAELDDDTLTLN